MIPAPEPADQRTKDYPGLGCKRNVGGHADDDAEGQPNRRTDSDCGCDRHAARSISPANNERPPEASSRRGVARSEPPRPA
jgi:hypothetical protein